ncbi:MAG: Ig-like domain-containing protein [Treponema sp.]|nr:Ig-like domain-containing protein [Treponema sp.]
MKIRAKAFTLLVFTAIILLTLTTCDLFEEDIAVTGVSLNKTSTSINVGATETLNATIRPAGATNTDLNWTSSNTTIATVSTTGVVTGVATGSAVIIVSTVDGGFVAVCNVTVTVPPAPLARPNGNGGVTVETNGDLRIQGDLWLFNSTETNPQLRQAGEDFNGSVNVHINRDTSLTIPEGIKNGKVDILITSPQTAALVNTNELWEDFKDIIVEGSNIRMGSLRLVVLVTGDSLNLFDQIQLFANPQVRQDSEGGNPYISGELFSFIYSMGNVLIQGTEKYEEDGATEEMDVNMNLASGWNSFSMTGEFTPTSANMTIRSKNPPTTGTRWILEMR